MFKHFGVVLLLAMTATSLIGCASATTDNVTEYHKPVRPDGTGAEREEEIAPWMWPAMIAKMVLAPGEKTGDSDVLSHR